LLPFALHGADSAIELNGSTARQRFDGIGEVEGGGGTTVLLKDYPEPQRSQILDLIFKPNFGASVSTLLVEIPGDGNATQGSMPSHMHTRGDLNYRRGYVWWLLQQAKQRNAGLTLDGTAWSAPGWVGNGEFWSQDMANYYLKWLQGLRGQYGLEMDALGFRNERGVSFGFAQELRETLNANGFAQIKLHGFDDWQDDKMDFVTQMAAHPALRNSVDILSAHTFSRVPASPKIQQLAAEMGKPIWDTEEHVYLPDFDCEIGIVHDFNDNFIRSGATKIVNWYGIAALYPLESYSRDPAMVLAYWPWSGHYQIREALWGYAHYGQFTRVGWKYLDGACRNLPGGGTVVALKSPGDDYSVIAETASAHGAQTIRFAVSGGLSNRSLCVWRSNPHEQFVRLPDIAPVNGAFTVRLEPDSIYSLSTTRGQQKGSFPEVPAARRFPFPYRDSFDEYAPPANYGYLPRYTADIADAFEIADRPDGKGRCLRQMVPIPTLSWAPDWQPYTIIGDAQWRDYQVGADIWLGAGETAGVMGRVNDVGGGWGFVPKGYGLQFSADGMCRLVAYRGKIDPHTPEGDAEQQALIKAHHSKGAGGEEVLASAQVAGAATGRWHRLTLRLEGTSITGLVDGQPVVQATGTLYPHGMAGLIAGGGHRQSMAYFNNLAIGALDALPNVPISDPPPPVPIYPQQ
jgi:galactosylceramidase